MAVKKSDGVSAEKKLQRPPVVVILGHVDHGKTSLLSKIKETDLTKKEFGGISQHIGTYQAAGITFIDTPGHVAFSEMRSRGAKVADLAVLVVAADEGVKPQTLESLKHLQKVKIPYLIAINKIDLPEAKIDWVKGNLAENKIMVEGYGGNVVAVPVSAKTGEGIKELLEMILLLVEMAEVKGSPQNKLEAVVIESRLDAKRGPLATILIRNGQLNQGDEIWVEDSNLKVKAMFDEDGQRIEKAVPSQPVQVLGFSQIPPVGGRVTTKSQKKPSVSQKKPSIEPEGTEKKFKIILKADTTGTLEAVLASFPDEVAVIQSRVGNINESDILLASTTDAQVIGFNVKFPARVKKLAESEKVKVEVYRIIYDLLKDIEKRVLKILEPTIDEEILGEAEIVAEFEIKDERIAGCRVKKGRISKQDNLHLRRGEEVLGNCKIKSLKVGKSDAESVKRGGEFGVVLNPGLDFKVGDVLISYTLPPKKDDETP